MRSISRLLATLLNGSTLPYTARQPTVSIQNDALKRPMARSGLPVFAGAPSPSISGRSIGLPSSAAATLLIDVAAAAALARRRSRGRRTQADATPAAQRIAPAQMAVATLVAAAMRGEAMLLKTEPRRAIARTQPIANAISLPRNQSASSVDAPTVIDSPPKPKTTRPASTSQSDFELAPIAKSAWPSPSSAPKKMTHGAAPRRSTSQPPKKGRTMFGIE